MTFNTIKENGQDLAFINKPNYKTFYNKTNIKRWDTKFKIL